MMPSHYTPFEGGDWVQWEGGEVTEKCLFNSIRPVGGPNPGIEGREVHSFKFLDGRRWDCINGWGSQYNPVKYDLTEDEYREYQDLKTRVPILETELVKAMDTVDKLVGTVFKLVDRLP